MKALTLWQPWATLIALGLKCYETRSWSTNYRGALMIHAAKRPCRLSELRSWGLLPVRQSNPTPVQTAIEQALAPFLTQGFTYGAVVAVADLTGCPKMYGVNDIPGQGIHIGSQTQLERTVGDWRAGRFAWMLEKVCGLNKSVKATGRQGLWIPDKDIQAAVKHLVPETLWQR